jgi:hypothetical protein
MPDQVVLVLTPSLQSDLLSAGLWQLNSNCPTARNRNAQSFNTRTLDLRLQDHLSSRLTTACSGEEVIISTE